MSDFHERLTTFPAVIGFSVILLGILGLLHCNVWPMVIFIGCELIWGSWRLWNTARASKENEQ